MCSSCVDGCVVLCPTYARERVCVILAVLSLQTQGPRPPYLQDVKLGVEDAAEEEKKKAANQSFFVKYVSVLVSTSGGGEMASYPHRRI